MNRSIVVVGSLNMDFVVRVGKLPLPGQTVSGQDFTTLPGGKGGNQAYAAGKLRSGAHVGQSGIGCLWREAQVQFGLC